MCAEAYKVGSLAARACCVTVGGGTASIDAHFLPFAIDVDLAGWARETLSSHTLLPLWVGALHLGTGIVDTAGSEAHSAVATRCCTTRVLLAAPAGLTLGVAVFVCFAGVVARIFHTRAIHTLLAAGTLYVVAGTDACAVGWAANLARVARHVIAGVRPTISVFTEVRIGRTLGVLRRATWVNANVQGVGLKDTDLVGDTVCIHLTLLQHFDFEGLAGTSTVVVAHFDLNFDFFASVTCSRLPRHLARFGVNRSAGRLLHFPGQSVSGIGIRCCGGVADIFAHIDSGGRFACDGGWVIHVAHGERDFDGRLGTFAVGDSDGCCVNLTDFAGARLPCNLAGVRVDLGSRRKP